MMLSPFQRKLRFPISFLFFLFFFSASAQYINYNGSFTLYQPNGKNVFLTGTYKDSIPDGKWTIYDDQGRLREVHHYRDGMLQDTFYQYSQGKILMKSFFRDNRRDGIWQTFDHDNSIVTHTEYYRNDTLNGWQKNGYQEVFFINGKADGPYVGYAWDHTVKLRGNYVMDSREGVWEHRLGNYTESYTYQNNVRQGPAWVQSRDSMPVSSCTYVNGKKEGVELVYRIEKQGKDKKSVLRESVPFVNGEKEGEGIRYFPNGDTSAIYNYRNDALKGWQLRFNKAGRLIEKRYWQIHSSEADSFYLWNDSGTLVQYETAWMENRLHKRWNDNGVLIVLDSAYQLNGETAADYYVYEGKQIVGENHWLNHEMHGRWYKKDHYEYLYNRGKLIKTIRDHEDFYPMEIGHQIGEVDGSDMFNEDPIPDRLRNSNERTASLSLIGSNPFKYAEYNGDRSLPLQESGVHGNVVIQVYVFRDGTPACPRIVKSLNPLADVEALRMALDSYWKVGKNKGFLQPGWRYFSVEF